MASNQQIDFTKIDYNELKQEIINFISSTTDFTDYNFEGSNLNLLVSLLAYVTNILSFNLNQAIKENYLPTANLRSNVLKIIKLLNYLPYRKNSAKIVADISNIVLSTGTLNGYLLKYDKIISGNYSFYYIGNPVEIVSSSLSNLTFQEGTLVSDINAYTGDNASFQYFDILDTTVGNNLSIFTTDNIGNRTYWELFEEGTTYTDPANAQIYFLEEINNGYRISFGNNQLGVIPSPTDVFGYEYLVPTSAETNNLVSFSWSGGGYTQNANINYSGRFITTCDVSLNSKNTQSIGYTEKETIDEIKFNAPKFFNTQARAVTEDDYYAIAIKHPLVSKASVIGGEKLENPTGTLKLGKVYITVKPEYSVYPNARFVEDDIQLLKDYFLNYSVVTIEPVVLNPQIVNLKVNSKLRYSSDQPPSTLDVLSNIQSFVNTENADFGEYFEYSKLTAKIDDSDPLLTSNLTTVEKYVTLTDENYVYDGEFVVPGQYRVKLSKNLYDTTQTNSLLKTKIQQFDVYTKVITYNEDVDYTVEYLDSDFVKITMLNTVSYLDIASQTSNTVMIGSAYSNGSTVQKIYPLGGDVKLSDGTVSNDVVDNTTYCTIYYSVGLQNTYIQPGKIIRFITGTNKNKLYRVIGIGSVVIDTNSGLLEYFMDIEPITDDSANFTSIMRNDLFEIWDSIDLNTTGNPVAGEFIKAVGVSVDFEGYYKIESIDPVDGAYIKIDTTSVEGLKELPTFTLNELDFNSSYFSMQPIYDFRFFFHTQDNDIFLNSNQIFNITYDENYGVEKDITLTLEKV